MLKKEKERQEIESLTALFLAGGGKISRHEPQERQAWKPLNERQQGLAGEHSRVARMLSLHPV